MRARIKQQPLRCGIGFHRDGFAVARQTVHLNLYTADDPHEPEFIQKIASAAELRTVDSCGFLHAFQNSAGLPVAVHVAVAGAELKR